MQGLPVMQGTSFAFIPVMIPAVKTAGLGALFGGIVIGGIFHAFLGTIIGRNSTLVSASSFRFDNFSNWYIFDTSWHQICGWWSS